MEFPTTSKSTLLNFPFKQEYFDSESSTSEYETDNTIENTRDIATEPHITATNPYDVPGDQCNTLASCATRTNRKSNIFDSFTNHQIESKDPSNNADQQRERVQGESISKQMTLRRRQAGEFMCGECGRKFKTMVILKTHKITHLNKKPFQCSDCFRKFPDKQKLKAHVLTHVVSQNDSSMFPDSIQELVPNDKSNDSLFDHSEATNYPCSKCDKTFKTEAHLEMHMIIHGDVLPFSCSVCEKFFNTKHSLQTHMLLHSTKKPYVCPVCNKTFRNKIGLDYHVSKHVGAEPYRCELCNKGFRSQSQLMVHDRIHTAERPYPCSMCEMTFVQKIHLDRHIISHSGLKSHVCKECGKCFMHKYNLKEHMLLHSQENPHRCSQCDKSFTSDRNLHNHMLIHNAEESEFKCPICAKSFTVAASLREHMALHTGDKPHICTQCGKSFARKRNLGVHRRTHIKEKTFQCYVCSKLFKVKKAIARHLESMHDIKPTELILSKTHMCVDVSDDSMPTIAPIKIRIKGLASENCQIVKEAGVVSKKEPQSKMKYAGKSYTFKCQICNKLYKGKKVLAKHLEKIHGEKPTELMLDMSYGQYDYLDTEDNDFNNQLNDQVGESLGGTNCSRLIDNSNVFNNILAMKKELDQADMFDHDSQDTSSKTIKYKDRSSTDLLRDFHSGDDYFKSDIKIELKIERT